MNLSSSKDPGDDEDEMDVDSEAQIEPPHVQPSKIAENSSNLAVLLRDTPNWLSKIRSLSEADVVVLLTPVVVPISQDPADISDPFEPLGRSLASRHPKIRHVPYVQRNGITSTHLGFIKRGHIIILCFAVNSGQDIEVELAEVLFAVSDSKPCIIVVCCSLVDLERTLPFPTVIRTAGYSPQALEATAALIFGESSSAQATQSSERHLEDPVNPKLWPIEQWNEVRDMSKVFTLWKECIGGRFTIDERILASLLRRPGYAKHYVARDSRSGEVLGFAATFLSYVDQEGEKLIASLALILVRSSNRKQGIGLSLHSHAIGELKRTRGVIRIQLGTTFPRILYGPPFELTQHDEWFRRRGWQLDKGLPGSGLMVHDLLLDFGDWRYAPGLTTLQFRICTQEDMVKVLEIVEKTSTAQAKMGWFDQYLSLMNQPNVKDVVLATESNDIVAVALTYTPSSGSQAASNLPWAGQLGNDVGGVSCICTPEARSEEIRDGLLDMSVQLLRERGMSKMFLDGITESIGTLVQLGFKEWARYRDVWRDV